MFSPLYFVEEVTVFCPELNYVVKDSMSLLPTIPDALKDFLPSTPGNGAFFKSELQAYSVGQVLERNSDLLVVLPTGGGKSLLFMLAAFMETNRKAKTTVVIVPLVSLKNDLRRRCDDAKLSCEAWGPESDPQKVLKKAPSLILVSAEQAVSETFTTLLATMDNDESLSRIVFDEFHLALTASDYRPVMENLRGMTVYSCPILALTATLPKSLEKIASRYMNRRFSVIRTGTSRRNIGYSVLHVAGKDDVLPSVIQQAVRCLEKASEDDRVIVFCPEIRIVNAVCAGLESAGAFIQGDTSFTINVSMFYGRMSEEEKLASFRCWRESVGGVMVATSAFGAGVDFAKVGQRA